MVKNSALLNLTRNFYFIEHTVVMKKRSKQYKEILNKLTYAKPEEVGDILKEYFNARKNNDK